MSDDGLDAKAQNVLNMCNLLHYVVEKDYGTLDVVEKVKIAKHLDGVLADFVKKVFLILMRKRLMICCLSIG